VEAAFSFFLLEKAPGAPFKYLIWLEKLAKDKHSSFLGTCGIAAVKSFITLVPDQHRAISC
jgi:hypothetical protein